MSDLDTAVAAVRATLAFVWPKDGWPAQMPERSTVLLRAFIQEVEARCDRISESNHAFRADMMVAKAMAGDSASSIVYGAQNQPPQIHNLPNGKNVIDALSSLGNAVPLWVHYMWILREWRDTIARAESATAPSA